MELLRPIGLHKTLTPAGEFAQIIVETGIIYEIPLEAHATMSSVDINVNDVFSARSVGRCAQICNHISNCSQLFCRTSTYTKLV